MKSFPRTLGAWLASGIGSYVLAALFSQFVVLMGLMGLGLEISLLDNVSSMTHAVLHMVPYLVVILLGFAIAFGVARGVKQIVPNLAIIAYPVAGAAAIGAALSLMYLRFGVFPILGAQETYGLLMQMAAGAVGGLIFERLRPKGMVAG
ncbi:MAG: hypothetical protein AAGL90_15745 [Pseudomonadota bacterium]